MSRGRVLMVDDEDGIRKSVRLTLTKAGYDVIEAEDGEKAIAAIRSGDNPLMVDTVICDLNMPKVNGLEAITFFRQQFPGVPVIVLTGHPNMKSPEDLFAQGVVEYLTKPAKAERLLSAVEKAVNSRGFFQDEFTV